MTYISLKIAPNGYFLALHNPKFLEFSEKYNSLVIEFE